METLNVILLGTENIEDFMQSKVFSFCSELLMCLKWKGMLIHFKENGISN